MSFGIKEENEYFRGLSEYRRHVAKSEGFDLEGIVGPQGLTGLLPYNCLNRPYPHRFLVNSYARLGLLRYNMLEGTSFRLHSLVKFNTLQNCVSSYYITLLANDDFSHRTFQVRVDELSYGQLDLNVSVSRIKDDKAKATTEKPFLHHGKPSVVVGFPDWPSDDSFNDKNRFHLVERSELGDHDWIPLCLDLAFYLDDRKTSEVDLSQLQIEKVAIEETEEDDAKSATVCIMYKDFGKAWVGEPVDRKAIFTRVINKHTGNLTLKGGLLPRRTYLTSSEMACLDINPNIDSIINNYAKLRSDMARPRHQPDK